MNAFSKAISAINPSLNSMKLDQFMKWKGLASTGGEAKKLISAGLVLVNGTTEFRRGRKLKWGDQIIFGNNKLIFEECDALGRRLASND